MAEFQSFLLRTCISFAFLFALTSSNSTFVCDPARFAELKLEMSSFAFCDKSLPFAVRVKDLVDQMTLEEKVQQLGNLASGVPRIGLPSYQWWSEALHGVSDVGPGTFFDSVVPGATSFPTVILTTASFNESLWKTIGQAVSTEARAMYNLGRAGLTYWSPTINVVRDPRWGRTIETPGEDPFIVGKYAATYVRGLQDVDGFEKSKDSNSRPLKVSSCCKHYTAYDVDNWKGVDRLHFDARVTEQDMEETFQRPFEMCVKEGDASSVMCSYNRVNGIPTCADPKLLNQTLRGEWDLHGYIVSDCDSIEVMVDDHKFLGDTNEDAVARTLKAGLNLDCGVYYTNFTANSVQQGKNDVCSPQNIELATEAAREGIVLLKNDEHTLPLNSSNFKTLAVVGPHANATKAMVGNYAGIPCRYTSPIGGFSAYANVSYSMGCGDIACKNDSLIFPAVQTAMNADATIILVGLDLSVEAEGLDRENLLLPGGVDISFIKNNTKIKAILWAGYPGEEGGQAIADIVFGKYNPGGRLPVTWYGADYVNMLPLTSMTLRPVDSLHYPGRTYRFFDGFTVYPFGYGLSYTQFKYNLTYSTSSISIKLDKFQHCRNINYTDGVQPPQCPGVQTNDLACNETIKFQLAIQNIGNVDGSEVVIVYSKPPRGITRTHFKQVIGFQRVFVEAGQSEKVTFKFNACESLKIVDYAANSLLPSGEHSIIFGDSGVSVPLNVIY
ncbi:hypothetical protein Patl1_04210 [Pistacia atlantica]|uniref:Uncharacterized protein n=1 Tax=Pistacia atlantica TaxID=434234 RepID=A0ACC1BXG8_9ROSI|nr:hypothetical protein Patl1_04210 [Pistacia atlantica]